jgi:hypothetical protein
MRADSLEVIILKQREIEKNLVAIQKEQLKDNRRKVRNFLKGTVAGVILTIIVDQVLHVVKDHKQSIKKKMGDTNPNIQRVSFEEIQEFKDLDLFNLTWEQTNGRQVLLAYDPRSQTLVFMLRQELTEVTKTFLCSMATLQL